MLEDVSKTPLMDLTHKSLFETKVLGRSYSRETLHVINHCHARVV